MKMLYVILAIGSIFAVAACWDFLQNKDRRGLRDDHEQFRDYADYKDY